MNKPTDCDATVTYPGHAESLPPAQQRAGRYVLRFARSRDDLDRITRLRFEVFNLEIGEGLASSWERCRDEDNFDAQCHHLMVTLGNAPDAEVVGTYRMQTQAMAQAGIGFYSDDEYDLGALTPILPQAVELGRACIARKHRNQRVLFLLWRGLAAYVTHNRSRYFFGCCSLTGQDRAHAVRVHRHLEEQGHVHPSWVAPPRAAYAAGAAAQEQALETDQDAVEIPPLMQLYLDHGARIVSPPAIDARFNTVDFLALFDVAEIAPRVKRMFFD